MTETMKKFKPPFNVENFQVYDADGALVVDVTLSAMDEKEAARHICDALNFYYAKKGEKE